MKLELQVVSLDLAKRLKELGVKQESLFYWMVSVGGKPVIVDEDTKQYYERGKIQMFYAFSVAELGELLPQGYSTWWYAKQDGKGTTLYRCAESEYDDAIAFEADTEADARAKMLIYLLEIKLMAEED